MKALSDRKVAIAPFHKGFTIIEINEEVNAHFSTVSRWIKQKREDPNNNVFDPLSKFRGNKNRRKCMDRYLDTMRRSVTASPGITVTEMKTCLCSISVSECTEYLQVIVMKTILKSQLFFYDFVVRTRPHVINHSPAGLFSVTTTSLLLPGPGTART